MIEISDYVPYIYRDSWGQDWRAQTSGKLQLGRRLLYLAIARQMRCKSWKGTVSYVQEDSPVQREIREEAYFTLC